MHCPTQRQCFCYIHKYYTTGEIKMTRQEILLNRFKHIKKMWLNSIEGSTEQKEWEMKMDICLEDMKKANKDAVNRSRIDYGANVLSHYITDTKKAQKATEIEITQEDNHA